MLLNIYKFLYMLLNFNHIKCFYKLKYKKVGVLPIWIVRSNVSSVGLSSEIEKDKRSKRLDFTIHIDNTPTSLYFDLYLNTAFAAHYV